MRSLLRSLLLAFIAASVVVASPCCCAEPENRLPLRRFHNAQTHEHLYTTNEEEAAKWRKLKHFSEQVIVGFVSPTEVAGTVRLYRGAKANGRQVYYVGERPDSVRTVDDNFKAYVWRTSNDDRVGVYCSTWTDGGDVYFDDLLEYIDKYSANTRKNLNVNRLRPQVTATFFVYPSPRRQAMQTPYTYQLLPGSYLLAQNTIFGGSELQQMPGDFGNLIVPDLAQRVFYTLTADVVRAHHYNAAFSQIDSRPVKYPTGYEDIAKVVFPIHRIRDYLLDHPVAYTHGNRLHLFVLTSTAGRVLTAEIPAFRSVDQPTQQLADKVDSPAVPAIDNAAGWDQPKASSGSMAAAAGGPDETVPTNPGGTRKSFADIIASCERSVVRIETNGNDGSGIGSGFVVDDRGTVVTNCHVLVGANDARIQFANGETAEVTLLRSVSKPDLAAVAAHDPPAKPASSSVEERQAAPAK